MPDEPLPEQHLAELKELRVQLQEATATLDAIRNGDVDALVMNGTGGEAACSRWKGRINPTGC